MRGQRWFLRRRRAGISYDAARTSQTTFLDDHLGQAGTLNARMLRRVGLRVEDHPNSEELKQASGVEFKTSEPVFHFQVGPHQVRVLFLEVRADDNARR